MSPVARTPPDATFSVVIPTYNRAHLIGRTLDSVFAQTWPAHEVIVVDNCSTDGSEDLLRPLAEGGRIRYMRNERNLERAHSRNTGMDQATGEYVTLLDSDDLMTPDNLAAGASFVQRHPDVRIFQNRCRLADTAGHVLHEYRLPSLRDHRRAICEGNFLSCIGVFLHRDVYSSYRFDPDPALSGSEDWELWLRVLARHRPGRIDEVNNVIVHHGGRTVTDVDLSATRARLELLLDKVRADPELVRVYGDRNLRRLEAGCWTYMATLANDAHDGPAARRLLWKAFRSAPSVAASSRFARILQLASTGGTRFA